MGLVVDLFAGGGGASVGLEAALGRRVDVAINHSKTALAVHAANHPETLHLTADIWDVDPATVLPGEPVDVLWASPDCTHFSLAKGDVPRDQNIRSLAWVVVQWAKARRPTCIFVENVAEFQTWGPLGLDGKPLKAKMGETFRDWCRQLEKLGYVVDWRVLDASKFGAPTKRRRLFIVARCDGEPVRWPAETHGDGKRPLRTAAECIDWSLPCPSIFEREKPLAEKTMWRIAQGIKRFVLDNPTPFIVHVNHGGMTDRAEAIDGPLSTVTASRRGHAIVTPTLAQMNGAAGHTNGRMRPADEPLPTVLASTAKHALVAPTLVQTGYGEDTKRNGGAGQAARALDLHEPLGTVVAGGQKHALVSAFLAKHFGGVVGTELTQPTGTITATDHHSLAAATLVKLRGQCHGSAMDAPLPTMTAGGFHVAQVRAFLTYYASTDATGGQALDEPLRTVLTKDRLGLVTVAGQDYQIVDIGMRMLQPHELLAAQFGRFAESYDLSAATTKAAQVRLIGNSVCPEVAEAIVRANTTPIYAELAA